MTLLLLAAPTYAATLNVGAGQPYRTINEAVTAASDGDTIRVYPGTYAENLDLRGRDLDIVGDEGPASTTLSPTSTIQLSAGTLEGFTIAPAPAVAIAVASGAPTLRALYIRSPATHGVLLSGGSATVEEVGVWNAGLHAFLASGGTPTIIRSMSYQALNYGFAIRTATTLQNNVAIGGAWGFVFELASSTASNLVAVGASTGGLGSIYAFNATNSVLLDNPLALRCFTTAVPTLPNGIAFNTATASGCTGTPLAAFDVIDPGFTSWGATLPFEAIDLRPTSASPLRDAGSGTDPDGSVADLGAFGGAGADWSDRDGDGYPVIFDCDDHVANTYPSAVERDDDRDNDCDTIVDEDIPVDTGGTDDTSVPSDTAGDTGETGSPVVAVDLDSDGFDSNLDCDEHNVATHPGALERRDGVDNDCDGLPDEGTAASDDDGDGFPELGGDCDDTRADRYPGATDDYQRDGVDNDCDGLPDDPTGQDLDGDGHRDSVDDCDDTDPDVNASAVDVTDSVDNDCDGFADDVELRQDADGDGKTPEAGDCDDTAPDVFFGNIDVVDDFIDQDCSGTDNYDADRDGHASPTSGGADCDDTRSTVYPGAAELCRDTADNNCDGTTDEDCDDGGADGTADPCGCQTPTPGGVGLTLLVLGAAVSLRRRRGVV